MRSMKKVFRGGVFVSTVTLFSKIIETCSFVTNALAIIVPSELYSITKINGFTKIKFQDIDNIITSKNAF